jgi:hypothetical protein
VLPSAERIGSRVIDHVIYVMTAREWKRHGAERRERAGLAASEHSGLASEHAVGRSE